MEPQNFKDKINITEKVKITFFDWIGRAFIALISFYAWEIHSDVKLLVTVVPVLQEKVNMLEKRVEQMNNGTLQYSGKKEEEITFDNIKKNK